jgi:hypothetical protein
MFATGGKLSVLKLTSGRNNICMAFADFNVILSYTLTLIRHTFPNFIFSSASFLSVIIVRSSNYHDTTTKQSSLTLIDTRTRHCFSYATCYVIPLLHTTMIKIRKKVFLIVDTYGALFFNAGHRDLHDKNFGSC